MTGTGAMPEPAATPDTHGVGQRMRPDPSGLAADAMRRGQELLVAGDPAAALRWLDRAHRLAPDDAILDFLHATALLRLNDRAARRWLERLAAAHDVREIWIALATATWLEGDAAAAAAALAAALGHHALSTSIATLASRVAGAAGFPGWCGLDGGGHVHVHAPGRLAVWLDKHGPIPLPGVGAQVLPAEWRSAARLSVRSDGRELLGSPIDLAAIRRIEGCVMAEPDGMAGWAWHPADPDRNPRLMLRGADGQRTEVVAAEPASVHHPGPLARPRLIHLSADAVAALGGRIVVTGEDGAELPGSPVVAAAGMLRAVRPSRRRRPSSGVVLVLDAQAGADPACFDGALAALPYIRVRGPADVAAALRPFPGCDLLWLEEAPPGVSGWLAKLQAAVQAAPDIGSAAALEVAPPVAETPVAGAAVAAPPPGCVLLRHDCLAAAGGLRPDFATTGAAMAELCLRSGRAGWRHVVVPDVVVPGAGINPAPAWRTLRQHDRDLLLRLHPAVATAPDALAPARRELAICQWQQAATKDLAILITHDAGGGIERVVATRAQALRAAGARPVVLRPAPEGCVVSEGDRHDSPDLRFRLPEELPALAALLAEGRPRLVELHHLLGHRHAVLDLARLLDVPLDIFVHDYAAFCPRIALVGADDRYCGEPDIAGCEACLAAVGSNLAEPIGPTALRARSADDLRRARRVVVPSADTARRLCRHFPDIRPEIVPWEDDAALPSRRVPAAGATPRVCVVGAIGVEKGYDVLLATVRAAAASHKELEFVVVGHTIDDRTLMGAGNIFVTGAYRDEELPDLIVAQRATTAFIPSIWPETWCFTLSHAWRAGLDAVVFDIGAPAERVRRTGRGVVVPLGLPPARIVNALVTAGSI